MTRYRGKILLLVMGIFLAGYGSAAGAEGTQPAAVIIISIDGLRPDVLLRSTAPAIRSLMSAGAFTMYARTTALAVTLPSHTSMLTGTTVARHGITWNDEANESPLRFPAVPTIFELAKQRNISTAMIAGKRKFADLAKPGSLDWSFIPDHTVRDDEVAANAISIIKEHAPRLTFVHFPRVDSAGHSNGWGAPEQIAAVGEADLQVMRVLEAFRAAHTGADLYVILTADHGGSGRAHGADDMPSAFIPFIITGPGVKKNFDLTLSRTSVSIEDVTATALKLLEIPAPPAFDGRPVSPAFE